MISEKYVLGIDTSNYKTSIAVVDNQKNIICDLRRLLKVKQGERGLRQSDALFQHIQNIPELMMEARNCFDGIISAVSYSSKPRPILGSYMPVFTAGKSAAESIGAMLNIPCFAFSHQEGHIEAVRAYSIFKDKEEFLSCHFSGGTTEILKVSRDITIVGGSKDISFGQVIDRAGVATGMSFPAGEMMDRLAESALQKTNILTKVKVHDGWLNLSGIDTQIKNIIKTFKENDNELENIRTSLSAEIFEKLSEAAVSMVKQVSESTGINDVLMAGGVCSSLFMRKRIERELKKINITASFDNKGLSSDNAVGTALLGGKNIWD